MSTGDTPAHNPVDPDRALAVEKALDTLRVTDPLDGSRYYLHPGTGMRHTSVTTILAATEGKPFLAPWSARLAAEFAIKNLAVLTILLEKEGEAVAVELVKNEAKRFREIKADAGSYVHAVQEALILWAASPNAWGSQIPLPDLPEHLQDARYDDQPLKEVVEWMVDGFISFTYEFDVRFRAAEMPVYHQGLLIAGTLDGIVDLPGVAITPEGRLVPAGSKKRLRLCIDTKTGRSVDGTAMEQIAAYRRMDEALLPHGDLVRMPSTQAAGVLHLRPNFVSGYRLRLMPPGQEADAWKTFVKSVKVFHDREARKGTPGVVVRPMRGGKVPPPLLGDQEGFRQVPGRLRAEGFTTLGEVSVLTAQELLLANGIGSKSVEVVRQMLAAHGLHLHGEQLGEERGAA